MSGQPHPKGVEELSGYLRNLEDARQGIAREAEVIALHREKLTVHQHNERAALKAIDEAMEEMDVKSPGNFGYEGRRLWLLCELNKQATRYGRSHP